MILSVCPSVFVCSFGKEEKEGGEKRQREISMETSHKLLFILQVYSFLKQVA
jgi:hypothetical protein